jgi:hypothetical protein
MTSQVLTPNGAMALPLALQHRQHHAFFRLHPWTVHLPAENGQFLSEDQQLNVL